MKTKRLWLAAGVAAVGICATLPMADAWGEIAGIPEVHESAVLDDKPMATTGPEILAGEPEEQYNGVTSGVVQVLSSSDGFSWIEVGRIGPTVPAAGMRFGDVIAVEGSQALIGAHPDFPAPAWEHYVFEETAPGAWSERARLVGEAGHVLGRLSAIYGETIVISGREYLPYGRGEVSIFERIGSSWLLRQRLVSDEAGDCFGSGPLAVAEDVLVVGAGCAIVAGADTGAAYVYVKRATGDWEVAQKLVPLPLGMDQAGYVNGTESLAASDDLIVAGSPCDWALGPAETCAGAAYVYRRVAEDEWVQEAKLLPPFDGPTPPYGAQFGHSVAISGSLVYVCENQGRWETGESGSCWVFRDSGGGDWQPLARLIPEDPFANLEFGEWIDLEGGTFLSLAYAAEGDSEARIYVFDTAALSLEVEVAIDIKPFDPRNQVDPYSPMLFPVGILSDDDFDALQTDLQTIRLEPGDARARNYRVYDANRDRIPDLVPLFRARDLRIGCGETEFELTGKTHDGLEFFGTDVVRNRRCPK